MPKTKFKIDEVMLVLIVALMAMAVVIYQKSNELRISRSAPMEAEKITDIILDDHKISFASNGVIDEDKIKEIEKMSYIEFKSRINAKNDFCVYIEDEKGNIILAKGSSKLKKDGLCLE